MKKKPNIKALKKKMATAFQKLRRLQCADKNGFCTCVTCGKKAKWNDYMQGGHYVSRKINYTLVDARNVHPQCSRCNVLFSGMSDYYYDFLVKEYGQKVADELKGYRINAPIKQFKAFEIIELTKKFESESREILKTLPK